MSLVLEPWYFQGYTVLNGVNSETVSVSHTVDEDKIAGLAPWLFSFLMILLIVLVVVVILVIVLACYCYKRRKADRRARGIDSRDSARKRLDGEDSTTGDEKQ